MLTGRKSKLSAEFSYPVGLELLTAHLKDVPQFSRIDLYFSGPTYPSTEFRKTVLADEEYPILSVRHSSASIRPPSYAGWSMWIYPVRRELKKIAKEALNSFGLPILEKWLTNHNVQNPIGGVRCVIVFVPLEGYVYLREPLNGFELRPETQKSSQINQVSALPFPR